MVVQGQFEVEFRKDGTLFDDAQRSGLFAGLDGLTNLLVICHGWNNDKEDAGRLYDAFVKSLEDVAAADLIPGVKDRRIGVLRVLWPSKKFAEKDLIPGGGAASAIAASDDSLLRLLDELARDPDRLGETGTDEGRRAHVEHAKSLLPKLPSSDAARREFVQSLRAILNPDEKHPEDGSAEFFAADPERLFEGLSGGVKAPAPVSAGGATSLGGGGAAGFLGDLVDGTTAAARRIANFATYYQMKTRAGTVGRVGIGPLLALIRQKHPDLPITLVGHSFGGRLVTAAAATLPPATPATSMLLLQAAYSHNGLAPRFDGTHDGAFRTVIAQRRLSGPILITHTKNDLAVGIAYPLASRIALDQAAALGDENDPYGGMGRNGAQLTPEAEPGTLHDLGQAYQLADGKIFNLRADRFISAHNDVTGPEEAYACAHLLVR
jgi:hypothetical protein